MVVGLFYLVAGAGALVAGAGALMAIPDPMLRATVAPAGFTILAVTAGALLLLRRERLLAGPSSRNPRPNRTNEPEPIVLPASSSTSSICTNEPEPAATVPALRPEHEEPGVLGPAGKAARIEDPVLSMTSRTGPMLDLLAPNEPEPAAAAPTLWATSARPTPAAPDTPLPICTNEPETALQADDGKVRFGAFSLFRRNRGTLEIEEASAPPRDEPGASTSLAAEPSLLETFSLPPVSSRLLEDLDSPEDLLDTDDSRAQSVARAVQEDSLVPVLVPVVSLPQRRRRMVRIRLDCRHLSAAADPHALLPAGAGPLRAALDLELLRAAVAQSERARPGSENLAVLAPVAIGSFADEDALAALRILLGRRSPAATPLYLVLDAWPTERPGLEMLALLRGSGVSIGLALNERPHLSPDAIASRRIGLVCLDAAELRLAALSASDGDLVRDIRALQRREIEVVVTGIGDERALAEVLDYPVHLGTGRLFGRIG